MNDIHPTSIVENCTLGGNIRIGPFCLITDCTLGDNVIIEGNTRLEKSIIKKDCQLLWGSIVRESTLEEGCVIGCEVKKSHLGNKNKSKHPGTSIISTTSGDKVNFGGGIKCANYDGTGKGFFHIGDNVFLGCNTVLSVKAGQTRTIAEGSKIGANLHISVDIPELSLVYTDKATGLLTIREGYYKD